MNNTNNKVSKVVEDKIKYNINNDKKNDLLKMKDNIVEYGH